MGADLDTPPSLVLTPRFPEHQALSTMRFDCFKHIEDVIFGLGAGLIDDHELFGVLSASYSVDERTVVGNEYGRETVEGKENMVKMGET